ncbi:hypothetical protein [Pseudanabaena sp. PCC 6802]|uniref:hypothetical protein n=1 Tax=Pseudanabaena sp. PCC 6802 TaxID=118173 RepID=UPI0012EA0969|nr:hypothetical protein [Pseudanabaena sp. PCC 6802]
MINPWWCSRSRRSPEINGNIWVLAANCLDRWEDAIDLVTGTYGFRIGTNS